MTIKTRSCLRTLLLVLVVAVIAAVVSVWCVTRIAETEEPPCRSCVALASSTDIPLVTMCDLQSDPKKYEGKLVRVRTLFYHDAGQVRLLDDACPKLSLHSGLADSFQSCAGTSKALSIYSGFGTWYDSTARVIVVGRLGRLENPTLYEDDGFNITCLEKVRPNGWGIVERIYFAVGKLFRLNRN